MRITIRPTHEEVRNAKLDPENDVSTELVIRIAKIYTGPQGPMPEFSGTNFLLHYTLAKTLEQTG